jgi:superfamily II DNA or RNA helicase
MLQSISKKDYPKELFTDYLTVIFDEIHHLGAQVFSQALPKVSSRYTLGLSATPTRQDGMSSILTFNFGEFIKTETENKYNDKTFVKMIHNKNEYIERKIRFGGINFQDLISQLTVDKSRNNSIISEVTEQYNLGKSGILVLSDRRDHIQAINTKLQALNMSSGLYIGGMKNKDRNKSEECRIVCGTYSMVAEGFDLPKLNVLIMCTPKKNIVQIVGRILRKKHSAVPLIIDIWDRSVQSYMNWGFARIKYYRKQDYTFISKIPLDPKPEPVIEYCFDD